MRLTLLGGTELVHDSPVPIDERFLGVLTRLVISAGQPVPASVLIEHGLRTSDPTRNQLHKAITTLRKALDPGGPGDSSKVIELVRGSAPAYRLRIEPSQVDLLWFEHLLVESIAAPEIRAIQLLEEALALWQGPPPAHVGGREWMKRIEQVTASYEQARRRLFELYLAWGLRERAAKLGSELLARWPGDEPLRHQVAGIATLRSARHEVTRAFPHPSTKVRIVLGDLFDDDQADAHLVIGFMESFDTNITEDRLVSSRSLQGQAVTRLYGGDHRQLDRALTSALRDVPARRLSRTARKAGKLLLYDIGTVAPVRQDGRYLFCLAYTTVLRPGEPYQPSLPNIERALDRLWPVVRSVGHYRPVALGLVGAGLARLETSPIELAELLLRSFLRAREQGRLTDELRLVLRPRIDPDTFLHSVGDLLYRL